MQERRANFHTQTYPGTLYPVELWLHTLCAIASAWDRGPGQLMEKTGKIFLTSHILHHIIVSHLIRTENTHQKDKPLQEFLLSRVLPI